MGILTSFQNFIFNILSLCFSMANVDGGLSDDLSEFVPNVCTNSPASGYYTILLILM